MIDSKVAKQSPDLRFLYSKRVNMSGGCMGKTKATPKKDDEYFYLPNLHGAGKGLAIIFICTLIISYMASLSTSPQYRGLQIGKAFAMLFPAVMILYFIFDSGKEKKKKI